MIYSPAAECLRFGSARLLELVPDPQQRGSVWAQGLGGDGLGDLDSWKCFPEEWDSVLGLRMRW